MNPNREKRMNEAVREAAAEFLAREANRQSLITVTNAVVSSDGHLATIYLTIFPESAELRALSFARRHGGELAEFFKKRVRGMRIPHIEFALDKGEKNRQRLDELGE